VAGVVVSADNNDTYEVAVSGDGRTFEVAGTIPARSEKGMRERFLFSTKLRGARELRIRPLTGTGPSRSERSPSSSPTNARVPSASPPEPT